MYEFSLLVSVRSTKAIVEMTFPLEYCISLMPGHSTILFHLAVLNNTSKYNITKVEDKQYIIDLFLIHSYIIETEDGLSSGEWKGS